MNISDMKNFQAIIEAGNISGAAKKWKGGEIKHAYRYAHDRFC